MLRISVACVVSLLTLLVSACADRQASRALDIPTPGLARPGVLPGWPAMLPIDTLLPGEELNAQGFVAPRNRAAGWAISDLAGEGEFRRGTAPFSSFGQAVALNGALHLEGAAAGQPAYSGAIYRIPLGGAQPGLITADAPLVAGVEGGGLYLGLADYSAGRWRWFGPQRDPALLLSAAQAAAELPADFTSPLGSVFVAVLVCDGASADVVGVGVSALDAADTTPPPAPDSVSLESVPGGLLVDWQATGATDLAGCRVYYHSQPFLDRHTLGVRRVESLQGRAFILPLPGDPPAPCFVRVASVDRSGNESALGPLAQAVPLAGPAPVLVLEAGSFAGIAPLDVELTATGAGLFDWDCDGDGIYETNGEVTGQATLSASVAGLHRPHVRLRDAQGQLLAQAGLCVHAARGWANALPNPDSAGNVGSYLSMAIVDGSPAVSYYDFDNSALKYVRALDSDGSAWGEPLTLDSADSVGTYSSLAVVDGRPAIGYYDLTNYDLKFIRAADATGSAWGEPLVVDGPGIVGLYISLAVVNGHPACSYYDWDNADLLYVRALDPQGSAWGAALTVDDGWDVGYYTSLVVVDGVPAIGYFDYEEADLRFVLALDASGAAWDGPQVLDSAGDVGRYLSLAVVNGCPALSYRDATNEDLKYIQAKNPQGSEWRSPQLLDISGQPGWYTSLAVVGGVPMVSYLDTATDDLKFVQAADADGLAWGSPQWLDSTGRTGFYSSLRDLNGFPGIAYYDATEQDLRFIRMY